MCERLEHACEIAIWDTPIPINISDTCLYTNLSSAMIKTNCPGRAGLLSRILNHHMHPPIINLIKIDCQFAANMVIFRESKPVDPTSISKISQYITPSGEKGSIIYTEPEV